MYRIYPVDPETCHPFRGYPVVALMKDGARQVGILGGVHNGQLILNDNAPWVEPAAASSKGKTARIRRNKRKKRAGRRASGKPAFTAGLISDEVGFDQGAEPWPFYPPNPFGSRVELDADSIDQLFLMPL